MAKQTEYVDPNYVPPRQPGRYNVNQACEECCINGWEPSLTKQSELEETDINNIVNRFLKTGLLPDNIRTPTYADYEGITDYHTAMNVITNAQSEFNRLPPAIRARFENDPGQFAEFCLDPENLPALREMGLAKPETGVEGRSATTPSPTAGQGERGTGSPGVAQTGSGPPVDPKPVT